jgi:hypothetical protein
MIFDSYALPGIVAIVVLIGAVYILLKRFERTGKRSLFDYLLIWPLVIEDHKRKSTKSSTKTIVIGVIIMVLLIMVDYIFNPKAGRG